MNEDETEVFNLGIYIITSGASGVDLSAPTDIKIITKIIEFEKSSPRRKTRIKRPNGCSKMAKSNIPVKRA